jgi:hypothetical protein
MLRDFWPQAVMNLDIDTVESLMSEMEGLGS